MKVQVFATALALTLLAVPALSDGDEDSLTPALDRLQLGDPEGAVLAALEVVGENPEQIKAWFLCGMVRFHNLGDFAGAVECLDGVIGLVDGGVEFTELRHALRGRGMSWFMLGEFARAEADLRAGVELEPDDVHAHLLWFLAARRAGMDGEKRLRRFAEAHDSDDWPHPLVDFYLGNTDVATCIAAGSKTSGDLCEAQFYVAEHYLLRGETELATEHFEKCLQTGKIHYGEYQMAQEELRRLAD